MEEEDEPHTPEEVEFQQSFLCPICFDTFAPPMYMCISCTKNFHKACILSWYSKSKQNGSPCPTCRVAPVHTLANNELDSLLELMRRSLVIECQYCKMKISDMETLTNHRSICVDFLNRKKSKILKKAEVLFEILRDTNPQIAVDLPLPVGKKFTKTELAIPNRRKSSEYLLFLLFVKKHVKIPHRYQIELYPKSPDITYPLRIGSLFHSSGVDIDISCLSVKQKSRIVLFDIKSVKEAFKLWIFAF